MNLPEGEGPFLRCFNARLCESLVELKSYVKKVSEEPWQYSWFVGLD